MTSEQERLLVALARSLDYLLVHTATRRPDIRDFVEEELNNATLAVLAVQKDRSWS